MGNSEARKASGDYLIQVFLCYFLRLAIIPIVGLH
ncbi:hypothetical protein SAMN05444285_12479 [Draconibacterium orientale]|uniref:Uncharacterized protein n=1 Tax=Draconibacterium orientale TaxID=1168034 RepID=A0A1I0HHC8_9BACT|nr:hypothetical protein SAMN05444285_12479 [Draconibacterium orientale]